jgi:hypothetical protein
LALSGSCGQPSRSALDDRRAPVAIAFFDNRHFDEFWKSRVSEALKASGGPATPGVVRGGLVARNCRANLRIALRRHAGQAAGEVAKWTRAAGTGFGFGCGSGSACAPVTRTRAAALIIARVITFSSSASSRHGRRGFQSSSAASSSGGSPSPSKRVLASTMSLSR